MWSSLQSMDTLVKLTCQYVTTRVDELTGWPPWQMAQTGQLGGKLGEAELKDLLAR
jgi:hypothetical protein